MAIEKLTEVDPLSELYSDLKNILSEIIIKFSYKAQKYETLETRKYVDEYLDALQEKDIYEGYDYTNDEFIAVGLYNNIDYHRENFAALPDRYKKQMLLNRRKKVIETYDEPNPYYRELNGLPPLDAIGAIIVNDYINNSFEVVGIDNLAHLSSPSFRSITDVALYHLIGSSTFTQGSHVIIRNAVIQDTQTSSRSFLIYDDDYQLDVYTKGIYLRDAKSILYNVKGVTDFNDLCGKYLFIERSNIYDTSFYFNRSFEVVSDDTECDNNMIKYSEAILNNKNVSIGDFILFKDFVYVNDEYSQKYGISTKVPLHKIRDYYGSNAINIMESCGYLNELISKYPTKEYLKYIGSKRIEIITARKARNFDILYFPSNVSKSIISRMFSVCYNGARDYFMNIIYNSYYNEIYDYYDNFIGISIMQMAINQTITKSIEAGINRDFYDTTLVRWLFEMYNVPYTTRIPYITQTRLVKNLNMLIQNKATNKVIYDIASILGYHDIQVYKYYLMKERRYTENDDMIYRDTTTTQTNVNRLGYLENQTTVINDVEKMYDVYFQKVNLKTIDFRNDLTDPSNRVEYDYITKNDPLWWEDEDTFNEVYGDALKYTEDEESIAYHKQYNFMESKYLGISISYKLSEILYNDIVLLRLIYDKKEELKDITLNLAHLTGTLDINLFDTITFLCALMCKQHNLTGEILTRYSSILDVMGFINEDYDGYKEMNTLMFNYNKLTSPDTFKEILEKPSLYLKDESETKLFYSYFDILTSDGNDTSSKIKALNQMFTNIRNLGYFIGRKMADSTDILEYRAWRDLYNSLYIGNENNELYKLGASNNTAKTYEEYLEYMNPSLYNILINAEDYQLHDYIDHVISCLEKYIKHLDSLHLLNDSNSSLLDYLIKLITFFKSYTTDLISVSTQYTFDIKPDMLFKIIDKCDLYATYMQRDRIKLMYSDSLKTYQLLKNADKVIFNDDIHKLSRSLSLTDNIPLNNIYCNNCKNTYCNNYCRKNKDTCDGLLTNGNNCKWFKYDLSPLLKYIDEYKELLFTIRYTYPDIQSSIRNHLKAAYDLYNNLDDNLYYDTTELERTLNNLNNSLQSHGDIIMTISDTGIEGIVDIINSIKESSKVCCNTFYPCLAGNCINQSKEDYKVSGVIDLNSKFNIEEKLIFKHE